MKAFIAAALSGKRENESLKAGLVFFGLALFWAVENFIIQGAAFEGYPTNLHPLSYQAMRFCINLMAASTVLLICSRPWLIGVIIVDFLCSSIVITYAWYFHQPLSIRYELSNVSEGLRVSSSAMLIIPSWLWILLIVCLAIKISWVYKITPHTLQFRKRSAACCLAISGILVLGAQTTSFKFTGFRQFKGTRGVYAYGYPITWIAEFIYSPDQKGIELELGNLQHISPDRLAGQEPSWPVPDKIVIVQMESVGWNVLNYTANGKMVTPYLNSLMKTDRHYRVQSFHFLGSADMDYAVLSGGTPSSRLLGYNIPNLTYPHALPQFLKEHGYHTVAMHGNDGSFYDRRKNFQKMGFDEIFFKREFAVNPIEQSYWGARDFEVFRASQQKLQQSPQRQFHFIITMDSHTPFDVIKNSEKEIYPESKIWEENYFNSMRALDTVLRDYIEALPPGTLVIMYGDHTSGVNYKDFHSAREGAAEFIPCIVHYCKTNQPQAGALSLPEDLRILDVMNHLRRQIAGAKPSN